jgi:hypothetical protein
MGAKKKYNHAVDVAFEVQSNHEYPTIDEMLEGMQKRLDYLKVNRDEASEALHAYDTIENE